MGSLTNQQPQDRVGQGRTGQVPVIDAAPESRGQPGAGDTGMHAMGYFPDTPFPTRTHQSEAHWKVSPPPSLPSLPIRVLLAFLPEHNSALCSSNHSPYPENWGLALGLDFCMYSQTLRGSGRKQVSLLFLFFSSFSKTWG